MLNTKLKQLRKESGLRQQQIADFLNVDQSLIVRIENGTRNLSSSMIDKLCNLFGCSSSYLLGETNEDCFIPLIFNFNPRKITKDDLEAIADINKIAMSIKYMNSV